MKEFEIRPFYIGQEVVAVKDHSQGIFKKGDEFKVIAIRKGCCQFEVYLGHAKTDDNTHCTICNKSIFEGSGRPRFFLARSFAPKIQLSEFISMKQLAETQLETIGAN